MSDGVNENALDPNSFTAVFLFRGAIGKGKYFIGLAAVIVVLVLAFASFATAMNPTGSGGGELLVIPLLFVVLYLHLAIVSARLRDSGRSPWLALFFVFGPFVFFAALAGFMEAFEAVWVLVIAGFFLFYVLPGLMKRKDEPAAA